VTVDVPVYQGAPLLSGWNDDPACTATGHFLEVEDDLVMPGSLRILAWRRTYSSRWIATGALGRGWYAWADVALLPGDGEVGYQGRDGQLATFVEGTQRFLGIPGIEAHLSRTEGGYELRWRWQARFPGMVWRFDSDGRERSPLRMSSQNSEIRLGSRTPALFSRLVASKPWRRNRALRFLRVP
jgi:hypothetical protein